MANSAQIFICVGKSGAGKSHFIRALGGQVPDSELRDDKHSVTSEAKRYPLNPPNQNISMIDTPGFDDTRNLCVADRQKIDSSLWVDDQANQRRLLELLNKEGISYFNGILWFVNEGKATNILHAQAQFIHSLLTATATNSSTTKWDHVVVMLKGSTEGPRGVRAAVEKATSNAEAAKRLAIVTVSMETPEQNLPGSDAHRVFLLKQWTPVGVWLRSPQTVAEVLQFIPCRSPIKWTNRQDSCEDCGQTGDYRAFYSCHAQVERCHLPTDCHPGYLIQVHGPRDVEDRVSSTVKKAIPMVLMSTGAIVAACAGAPIAIPALISAHAFHCVLGGAILGGAGGLLKPLLPKPGPSPSAPTPTCCITGETVPQHDFDRMKHLTTLKGKCEKCGNGAATSEGCLYIWTCCLQRLSVSENQMEMLDRTFGDPCGTRCEVNTCDGLDEPGCTRRCRSCLRYDQPRDTENGRDFLSTGCGRPDIHEKKFSY